MRYFFNKLLMSKKLKEHSYTEAEYLEVAVEFKVTENIINKWYEMISKDAEGVSFLLKRGYFHLVQEQIFWSK